MGGFASFPPFLESISMCYNFVKWKNKIMNLVNYWSGRKSRVDASRGGSADLEEKKVGVGDCVKILRFSVRYLVVIMIPGTELARNKI